MLPANVIEDMRGCKNSQGQSVIEHGERVYEEYDYWKNGIIQDWKRPDWLNLIKVEDLHDEETVTQYCYYHDCGKPYCRVEDSKGVHYPDHAKVSSDLFLSLTGNKVVSKLIANDMVIHSGSAEEIEGKLNNKWSKQDALTLLIVALCEIHANAELFGGITSTSFKIKWATINRRGKQIIRHFGLDNGA